MSEKDEILSTQLKQAGVFSFKDFYKFLYDWLVDEKQMNMKETEYKEKIKGDAKDIDIKWEGYRELTDYFKFDIKVGYEIRNLKEVEVTQEGKKVKTNKGDIKIKLKGYLVRDYEGKFEKSGFMKFLREIYQKWVIKSRVDQFKEKIMGDCNDFLEQAKAYLDLEGKK